MSEIRFTAADQRRFAALSGDRNPVHLDSIAARRIAAGQPIVHGMHLLLRMLDRNKTDAGAPTVGLTATFLQPAFVAETIVIDTPARGELTATASGGPLLARTVVATAGSATTTPPSGQAAKVPSRPRVRTLLDCEGLGGAMTLPPAAPLARAFPTAARALGADVVAALAGISALVGMECPGRDSLLSAVRLRLTRGARLRRLDWRVVRADRRFGLLRIEMTGGGVAGTIDAFVRPQPTAPPAIADAAALVHEGEFQSQRALIVGGSRGLGAAAAVLLAAGGGLPVVTYASGAADAAALRRKVRAAGHAMEALRLDVTDRDAARVIGRAAARHGITHVYYCATPRIFARRRPPFDRALFDRFCDVYVDAFARLCASAHRRGRLLVVFYPSSVAVDDTPAELTEYAAAKAAGECACAGLERSIDGLSVFVTRLPRVATDQSASIVPTGAASAIQTMLSVVREMQRRASEESQ